MSLSVIANSLQQWRRQGCAMVRPTNLRPVYWPTCKLQKQGNLLGNTIIVLLVLIKGKYFFYFEHNIEKIFLYIILHTQRTQAPSSLANLTSISKTFVLADVLVRNQETET